MGSGIAQVCVQGGYQVKLVDMSADALSKASASILQKLSSAGKKKYSNESECTSYVNRCMESLSTSTALKESASNADLVIEAIVEKLDAKRDLFRLLEEYTPTGCVLVSNTSSLSLKDISSLLNRKDKFAGLHFFLPVPVLRLVEVVRTEHTSDPTFQSLLEFTRSLDKVPIACRDTPGFVVNRLLVPYALEAVRLVERGCSSIEDVDVGMKLGAGYPMGPFELMDFIGLDTMKHICDSFLDQLPGDPMFICPALIQKLVSEGKLGKKSGEGFYIYDSRGRISRQ